MEEFAGRSSKPHTGFSQNGFVEISKDVNREITIHIVAPSDGKYLTDFRYSNGSGPWNTDNKCAVRSLYHDDQYKGSFVFPQRGTDEWSDWGYSNPITLDLKRGTNLLILKLEPWNTNMNVDINQAMLDYFRVIKLE